MHDGAFQHASDLDHSHEYSISRTAGTTDQLASSKARLFPGCDSTEADPREYRAAKHASLNFLVTGGPLFARTIKSWACDGGSWRDWTKASVLSGTLALCCMSYRWESNDAAKAVLLNSRP